MSGRPRRHRVSYTNSMTSRCCSSAKWCTVGCSKIIQTTAMNRSKSSTKNRTRLCSLTIRAPEVDAAVAAIGDALEEVRSIGPALLEVLLRVAKQVRAGYPLG